MFYIKKEVMLNFSDMELEVRNDKKCRISYCLNCMKLDFIVMIQKIIQMNADDERRTKDKFRWPHGLMEKMLTFLYFFYLLFLCSFREVSMQPWVTWKRTTGGGICMILLKVTCSVMLDRNVDKPVGKLVFYNLRWRWWNCDLDIIKTSGKLSWSVV